MRKVILQQTLALHIFDILSLTIFKKAQEMKAQEFHAKADELFLAIEQWLEMENDDIDFESQEGRLTIILPNEQQLIFSRQTSLSEIWLASPQGAYHFQYIGEDWCTRQGQTLLASMVSIVQEQTNIRLDVTHFRK